MSAPKTGSPMKVEFQKFDKQKPRTDLLSPAVIVELAEILGHGAKKYGADNWQLCETWQSTYVGGAALRHIFAYMAGEEMDPESGLSHLVHAMCSLMFARALDLRQEESEDPVNVSISWPEGTAIHNLNTGRVTDFVVPARRFGGPDGFGPAHTDGGLEE